MRHVIPISGKDSLATALLQTAIAPGLPYEFIFNDTGSEYPEVYSWLEKIEVQTGWKIERIGCDLLQIVSGYGGFLPSPKARYCTREAKISPTIHYLKGEKTTIYYGLRSDENRIGYVPVGGDSIIPKYPLQEYGIDLSGVYAICKKRDLLPPYFFWERLYKSVSDRLSDIAWEEKLSWYQKQILFSGRSRANCFHCFFQRKYEWLWLYESHPDLFAKAKNLEKDEYTHMAGYPLSRLEDKQERDRIFASRVKEIVATIVKASNLMLFEIEQPEISAYSCGLMCGK